MTPLTTFSQLFDRQANISKKISNALGAFDSACGTRNLGAAASAVYDLVSVSAVYLTSVQEEMTDDELKDFTGFYALIELFESDVVDRTEQQLTASDLAYSYTDAFSHILELFARVRRRSKFAIAVPQLRATLLQHATRYFESDPDLNPDIAGDEMYKLGAAFENGDHCQVATSIQRLQAAGSGIVDTSPMGPWHDPFKELTDVEVDLAIAQMTVRPMTAAEIDELRRPVFLERDRLERRTLRRGAVELCTSGEPDQGDTLDHSVVELKLRRSLVTRRHR